MLVSGVQSKIAHLLSIVIDKIMDLFYYEDQIFRNCFQSRGQMISTRGKLKRLTKNG